MYTQHICISWYSTNPNQLTATTNPPSPAMSVYPPLSLFIYLPSPSHTHRNRGRWVRFRRRRFWFRFRNPLSSIGNKSPSLLSIWTRQRQGGRERERDLRSTSQARLENLVPPGKVLSFKANRRGWSEPSGSVILPFSCHFCRDLSCIESCGDAYKWMFRITFCEWPTM